MLLTHRPCRSLVRFDDEDVEALTQLPEDMQAKLYELAQAGPDAVEYVLMESHLDGTEDAGNDEFSDSE